jgi:hypothetical protein
LGHDYWHGQGFLGFEAWQPHTFPILWGGYIVTLNALTYQRSSQCLLLDRPRFLAQLFLLSAGFWWLFEYLNQYINIWHYVNLPDNSHFEYFLHTSIAFSTLLPAVLSTYKMAGHFSSPEAAFRKLAPAPLDGCSTDRMGFVQLGKRRTRTDRHLADRSFPAPLAQPLISSSWNPIPSEEKDVFSGFNAR